MPMARLRAPECVAEQARQLLKVNERQADRIRTLHAENKALLAKLDASKAEADGRLAV